MPSPIITSPLSELKKWLVEKNEPEYRAGQIHDWIFKKFAASFSDMKNIPARLRAELDRDYFVCSSTQEEVIDAEDGTEKILLKFRDGGYVECVLIPSDGRRTFCLSSQIGCPVGCRFCASGKGGLERNLESFEIIEEFLFCCRRTMRLPDNVVFMGIGEPLMNYANFMDSLRLICGAEFFGMSPRRITVSTSGFVPGIRKLADEERPWNLAVSLHGADDETRAGLIPDKFRYPLDDIMDACRYYFEKTGRIITFEWTLLKGINDSEEDAVRLAGIAEKCRAKVNLIPYNQAQGSEFKRPENYVNRSFEGILKRKGIPVTLRVEKGNKINAACGQLRIITKDRKHEE